MSQLLDLQVEIAARPPDASPETAAPITLRCEALKLKQVRGMFSYPLTKNERNDLRWYLEEYWKWPFEGFAQRGSSVEQLLPVLGQRLYHTVFGQGAAKDILQQWQADTSGTHQISIITTDAGFLSLPWELLHDGEGFLALYTNPPISIVRRIAEEYQPSALATTFDKPLRVLLVTARPVDEEQVDVRIIARELLDVLQDQIEAGTIELEFLRPPTFDELIARLDDKNRPVHVLHFDGHGIFYQFIDSQNNRERGRLFFEKDDGTGDPVDATSLAEMLSYAGVQVAVLNACQSAVIGEKDIFSSVAVQLLQNSVQVVVAMSASVMTTSASLYVKAFYGALVAGGPVQAAHEQAQKSLYAHPERNPLQHRLDEAGKPVHLQDWWLPYLYLQRPLALLPVREEPELQQPHSAPTVPRLNSILPDLPPYKFRGRSAELLSIERALLPNKDNGARRVVVISGFSGIGKTILAREAAEWLTRTKMFVAACFTSFEHGGDAASLLSALRDFLSIKDGNYDPRDWRAALAIVGPLLKQQPILIIVDNLESILPGGDAPLDDAGRTQFWDVLLGVTALGVGVLITSRNPAFGDQRLATSDQAAYLALGGLAPDDAYELAAQALPIDLARIPYAEVCDLLALLDYHPLAIQLMMPALQNHSFPTIRAEFATFLSNSANDQETGRNASLTASLQYSLQRLGEEQQALLLRLAPFRGGALEPDLLDIMQITSEQWQTLRQELEQAGLLMQDVIRSDMKARFQHFHPVLTPYLSSLPGADDAALLGRYTSYYSGLAYILGARDSDQPERTRAIVQRELPNLLYALDLLLQTDDVGLITATADLVIRFLEYLGRWRERSALRSRVLARIRPADAADSRQLTWSTYWQEKSQGEQELEKGNSQAATKQFQSLLFAMESLPADSEIGPHSLPHALVLQQLERALHSSGQSEAAFQRLQQAWDIACELLAKTPQDQEIWRVKGTLLCDKGDILRDQGQYTQAKQSYEESLRIAQASKGEGSENKRDQAIAQFQLGTLALRQEDYFEALKQYTQSRERFHELGEQPMEATVLHQMGMASAELGLTIHRYRSSSSGQTALANLPSVEVEQQVLAEAEQSYRESLKIEEQLGDAIAAAETCNQLAILTERTGRYTEAKGWYLQALKLVERGAPYSRLHEICLGNLATLLINDQDPDRMAHLAEARAYAEQASKIAETLAVENETWIIYRTLGTIATLEGKAEVAQDYHRHECEVYAAFSGHWDNINQHFGQFIANIATAVHGDEQDRAKVEPDLSQFEADPNLRSFATAIRRIWAGERDWHTLATDLTAWNALMVLQVLEILQER